MCPVNFRMYFCWLFLVVSNQTKKKNFICIQISLTLEWRLRSEGTPGVNGNLRGLCREWASVPEAAVTHLMQLWVSWCGLYIPGNSSYLTQKPLRFCVCVVGFLFVCLFVSKSKVNQGAQGASESKTGVWSFKSKTAFQVFPSVEWTTWYLPG